MLVGSDFNFTYLTLPKVPVPREKRVLVSKFGGLGAVYQGLWKCGNLQFSYWWYQIAGSSSISQNILGAWLQAQSLTVSHLDLHLSQLLVARACGSTPERRWLSLFRLFLRTSIFLCFRAVINIIQLNISANISIFLDM